MKKILILIYACIGVISIALADTMNVTWYNIDNTVYDTTTCTVGGTLNLPTAPTRYGYTFKGWIIYTPIEYIESTGTQYIDTKIRNTQKVQIGINVTAFNDSYTLVYGSQSRQNPVTRRSCYINRGNVIDKFSMSSGSENQPVSINVNTNFTTGTYHDITVVFSETPTISLDGQTTTSDKTSDNASTELDDYLFCYNLSGNASYNVKAKIYFAKIWKENSLVRDFIPVLDSNGVACMYDKISNTFFYNNGTGDFIAGPAL